MRHYYYKLVNKVAVPATLLESAASSTEEIGRVALTKFPGLMISTVFLGINCEWRPDMPPLIFETMIFVNDDATYEQRYSTWEEAEAGHAVIAALASTLTAPSDC